jgi:hypothetical protein
MDDLRSDDLIRRNHVLIEAAAKVRGDIKATQLKAARARVRARTRRAASRGSEEAMADYELVIFGRSDDFRHGGNDHASVRGLVTSRSVPQPEMACTERHHLPAF